MKKSKQEKQMQCFKPTVSHSTNKVGCRLSAICCPDASFLTLCCLPFSLPDSGDSMGRIGILFFLKKRSFVGWFRPLDGAE
jgi:hypothetical protein